MHRRFYVRTTLIRSWSRRITWTTNGAGSLEEARMGAKKTTGRLCNSLRRGIHGDVEGGGKVEVRQNSELSFGLQGDSLVLSEQASIWSYLGEREF